MNFQDVRWSSVLIVAVATLASCLPDGTRVEDPLLKALNGPRIPRTDDTAIGLTPPPFEAEDNQHNHGVYQSPLVHQNSENRKKRTPTFCHKCGHGGGYGGGGWGGGGGGWGGGGCGGGGCGGGGGSPTKIIVVPVTIQKGWGGGGGGWNKGGGGGGGGCGSGCCSGNCGGGGNGGGGGGGYGGSYSSASASASASSYSSGGGGGYGGGWGKK